MSLTKIPDSLLKKFQCAACCRYLSMAPIYMRADGETICNRCTNWIARCTVYEELARFHLFPCNYRSQGCTEYVQFNRASEHEKKCAYHTYSCPVNVYSTCKWTGPIFRLPDHYKDKHPELYLDKTSFRIDLEDNHEAYYLVEVDGVLLLLQVQIVGAKCWFNAVYMGNDEDNVSFITYHLKLSGEDATKAMEFRDRKPLPINRMEMITHESLEVDTAGLLLLLCYPESIQCQWFVSISNRLQKNQLIESKLIKCCNCKFSMVPPIFRCFLGHVICVDCKGYTMICKICQEANVEFSRAIDLENIAQAVKFVCKWRNCQLTFNCNEIRNHEQQCPKRIFRCPECKRFLGTAANIFKHFDEAHRDIPLQIADSDTLRLSLKSIWFQTYVLVHNEIFHVSFIKDLDSTWILYVTYHGPPGLASLWTYEITDRQDVLCYASKYSHNVYKATQTSKLSSSSMRSESHLLVRFHKQKALDLWIPFEPPSKRKRT